MSKWANYLLIAALIAALARLSSVEAQIKRQEQLRAEAQSDYRMCQADYKTLTDKADQQTAAIAAMSDRTEEVLETTADRLIKAQASYRPYRIIVPDTGSVCERYENVNLQMTEHLK